MYILLTNNVHFLNTRVIICQFAIHENAKKFIIHWKNNSILVVSYFSSSIIVIVFYRSDEDKRKIIKDLVT